MVIFDIQKFSVHDGPGIRTIVFFKGCPLTCQWCANPESHSFEPQLMVFPDKCIGCGKCAAVCKHGCYSKDDDGQIVFDRTKCTNCCECTKTCYTGAHRQAGNYMTLDEVKDEVDKDLVFYKNSGGGITFSGGEAMCFPDEVYELAKYYKELGVSTAIETCGCIDWENYEKVLPYMDLVMFDLKIMDDEKHKKYTGGSNSQILENLKKIAKRTETVVRIPIVPGINSSEKDIESFGKFISGLKENINTIHILPYHNLGVNKYVALDKEYLLENVQAPTGEDMNRIKSQLETYGFNVNIGG